MSVSSLNIVAIIQARLQSQRLPKKVLLDIGDKPMLAWVVERTRLAKAINQVVVATTTESSDDEIENFCQRMSYPFVRGSMADVLDRYYQAALQFNADVIVRITADCPLIDPALIDETVHKFLEHGVDFAANRLPPPFTRTYPIGMDTEVVSMQALKNAWQNASLKHEREHVMPFFYEQPGRFKILQVDYPVNHGHRRWTVDTQQDLELIREIVRRLNYRINFSWLDVLALFEQDPELEKVNAMIQHKTYLDFEKPDINH